MTEDQFTLEEIHVKLLTRGVNSEWIGLSNDMMFRMGELAALGELHRAGLAENTTDELPPGPVRGPTPSRITQSGRDALAKYRKGT